MKNFTKRNQIIFLNVVFIILCVFALYEDYKAKGRFQWIDPNDYEDEFGFNIIAFGIIVLSFVSIFYQIFNSFKYSLKNSNRYRFFQFFFNIVNAIHGLFGLMLGAFISMSSLSMFLQGNETASTRLLFLLLGICFTYSGYLIISRINTNQK